MSVFERYYASNPWITAAHGVNWADRLIAGTLSPYDVDIPLGMGSTLEWQHAMLTELIRRARSVTPTPGHLQA